jgi:hypothetical protein
MSDDLTRVTTQFRLPDGSLIDVFVRVLENGTYEVTDAGDTLGWVRQNSGTEKRTEEQDERIATALCSDPDVVRWVQQWGRMARTFRPPIEVREGEIVSSSPSKADLEATITRVARVASAVAIAGLP